MTAIHRIDVPPIGDSVEQVTVVEWHVGPGDSVASDDPLVTIGADKLDVELPSPISGKLVEILAPAGAELAVGEPLCRIEG